ncbi:hypothetical protein RHMOL_Rhmol07G0205000 [Rhododendron molle]|uniref:Uncharacterized protein n=1 Tax=Rhododendron molle TaxID=49168 RepID=A0ACC0N2K2_RHOML|nr:hypothetical protein RHMOL_Rhmol07G0205000 [Rhododendron molle]
MILAQASSNFKTFFETGLAVEEAVQLGILENTNNPNAFCAFHQMPGHATNDCHHLIDDGSIPMLNLRSKGGF